VWVTDRQFHGPRAYLDLARSDEATPEDLRRLAASPYAFVVEAVAQNPATPPEVLGQLVPAPATTWNEQSLLLALARHPSATEQLLRQLAQLVPPALHLRDSPQGFEAGIALFERSDTPDNLLLDLLGDSRVTTEFRKVAARQTSHDAVLTHLLSDRSDRVRRAARARGRHPAHNGMPSPLGRRRSCVGCPPRVKGFDRLGRAATAGSPDWLSSARCLSARLRADLRRDAFTSGLLSRP
jgi:hypothetical protein